MATISYEGDSVLRVDFTKSLPSSDATTTTSSGSLQTPSPLNASVSPAGEEGKSQLPKIAKKAKTARAKKTKSPEKPKASTDLEELKDPSQAKHNEDYLFCRYHLQPAASCYAYAPSGEPLRLTGMRIVNITSLDQNEILSRLFRYGEIKKANGLMDFGATGPEQKDSGLTADLAISSMKTPFQLKIGFKEGTDGNEIVNLAYYHYMRLSRPDYLDLAAVIQQCHEKFGNLKILEKDIRELPGVKDNPEAQARVDQIKSEKQAPNIEFTPEDISKILDTNQIKANNFSRYLSQLEDFKGQIEIDPNTALPKGANFKLFDALRENNYDLDAVSKLKDASGASIFELQILELKKRGIEGVIQNLAEKREFLEIAITKGSLRSNDPHVKPEMLMTASECVRFKELFGPEASPGGLDIALLQTGEPIIARARINVEKRLLELGRDKSLSKHERELYNIPDLRIPWRFRKGVIAGLGIGVGGTLIGGTMIAATLIGGGTVFPMVAGGLVSLFIARKSFGWICKNFKKAEKKMIEEPLKAAQLGGTPFIAAAVVENLLEDIQKHGWVKKIGTAPSVNEVDVTKGDSWLVKKDDQGVTEPDMGKVALHRSRRGKLGSNLVDTYISGYNTEAEIRYKAQKQHLDKHYQHLTGESRDPNKSTSLLDQIHYGGLIYDYNQKRDILSAASRMIKSLGLSAEEVLTDNYRSKDGVNRFSACMSQALFMASANRRNDEFKGQWCEIFPAWLPILGGEREPERNMNFVARRLNLARAEIEMITFNYGSGFTAEERREQDAAALKQMTDNVVGDLSDRFFILRHKYMARFEVLLGLDSDPKKGPGIISRFIDSIIDIIPNNVPNQ